MNNVFVVGTPLQLLSAYILAGEFFPEATNQLLLINPRQEKLWHSSTSLQRMASDQTIWSQIVSINYWLRRDYVWNYPRQMRAMRERLTAFGSVTQVFLGSDKIIQNQILVELLGCTQYARLEDGIWSYHNRDRRELSKLWQYIRIKFFRHIGGISSQMQHNFGGVGHGRAANADYLFKPELLERPSPAAVQIERAAVQRVMSRLTQDMQSIAAMSDSNCLLFLGSTFVESNDLSPEEERKLIGNVYQLACTAGMTMVYKPHPREDAGKVESYAREYPELTVVRVNDPIEVIYAKHHNLKCVVSICSSGLLYADVFSQDIVPIGLFKLCSLKQCDAVLARMMEKAGVMLPENLAALRRVLDKKETVTF
ncbi:polysialyltransferase family glycosyltransferase [Sporomusa acidovorans]|uniref:Capsule polysaccharide biosynthesis protein n=1 Tax=Sporomusa acidovorans (strain ATCC 49682 / DSM 3132 / Mol) TaxID=1123286 RepID=A0ABZ3J750_SPOA4|nr:polysialyltransferase family glycosyltransferase [Sporomusa acidovorans]OZC19327.1 glycosyltransferase family 52 [Sporomusa acidovorans DSM 3132]SDD80641.1 hypothetical protein SAMN04488499_1004101 [Sporomusa acidovorans]